ncbi:hypothetical protein AcV5_008719 [Taiwanofungus camphoratus]|nr:hypothetical protein AcV5_008719 [Antrodia cinnamomea]
MASTFCITQQSDDKTISSSSTDISPCLNLSTPTPTAPPLKRTFSQELAKLDDNLVALNELIRSTTRSDAIERVKQMAANPDATFDEMADLYGFLWDVFGPIPEQATWERLRNIGRGPPEPPSPLTDPDNPIFVATALFPIEVTIAALALPEMSDCETVDHTLSPVPEERLRTPSPAPPQPSSGPSTPNLRRSARIAQKQTSPLKRTNTALVSSNATRPDKQPRQQSEPNLMPS